MRWRVIRGVRPRPRRSNALNRRVGKGIRAAVFIFVAVVLVVPAKAADDVAQESRFITSPRQLIFEGRRSGEGYFSPDAAKLIFQSEREEGNPFYQMYVLDSETGDTTRVSPGTGKTTCGFFQPGTDRVIFASTHADPQAAAKTKSGAGFSRQRKTTPLLVGLRRELRHLLRETRWHRSREPDPFARLRCRRDVLAGWKANRLLFAARRISARQTFARTARSIRKGPVLVWRHLHDERRRLERAPL